jgi:hypothetical protein
LGASISSDAIGGVKLKVHADQMERANTILNAIKNNKLTDEDGDSDLLEAFHIEQAKQIEILEHKIKICESESLLDRVEDINSDLLSQTEILEILLSEKKLTIMSKRSYGFTWKQFWYELLGFNRSFFKYLKPSPVDYYLDKELVDLYQNKIHNNPKEICPNCKSDNVSYGYAIDYKWDILFLGLSFVLTTPCL